MGGLIVNFGSVLLDMVWLGVGLFLWLAFFAQFVLPVSTLEQRRKIIDRLIAYLFGGHGPAIFIRDGRLVASKGEKKKKGPGVLWLDSASAAVTRTATSFKQTLGPGVHFTEKDETIANNPVDLHKQAQRVGPRESEDPFAPQKETQSDEEYKAIQDRREQVRAWTRDGIEVVPNISVVFKIDADPVQGDHLPGSRFGYIDTENQEDNPVFKAIAGEGVNPDLPGEASRHRVSWNQLPALIAVDLWREYLGKFTLKELFETREIVAASPLKSDIFAEATRAMRKPVTPSKNAFEKVLVGMLHEINHFLALRADKCEFKKTDEKTVSVASDVKKPETEPPEEKKDEKETALQTIARMVKARMTEESVLKLDDSGLPTSGHGTMNSPEYAFLKSRGIRVLSVSISNLRFAPDIEKQLVDGFKTTWMLDAVREKEQIERKRGFVEVSGQVDAVEKYARSISAHLIEDDPDTQVQKDALKKLLLRTRDELIKNDRLHRRASMEREELEEIIQWVERNGS
ncbi:MAG: hypothetical protein Kow002_00850 [Anaerolineales bacterium]